MFCISRLTQVAPTLAAECRDRLLRGLVPIGAKSVRVPLCLLFVRARADLEKDLKPQMETSYGYFYERSGDYLDVVLPGWDTEQTYQPADFANFELELQRSTKWQPQSTTNALILDYVFNVESGSVVLDFSQCISLPLGEMIAEKRLRSLDAFMTDLINIVLSDRIEGKTTSAFRISDLFAAKEGIRVLSTWLKSPTDLATLTTVFKEFRPYAICDLRRDA